MSENSQFCYINLATGDLGKAREFYGKLFSWDFQETDAPGNGKYLMIQTNVGPRGGIFPQRAPEMPTAWTPYVQVEDVAGSVKQAQSLGGEVVIPLTVIVGGMGSYSILRDPTGGVIGVWQP